MQYTSAIYILENLQGREEERPFERGCSLQTNNQSIK